MTHSSRTKLFAFLAWLGCSAIFCLIVLVQRLDKKDSTQQPSVQIKIQPNEKVSYDNERKCNVLDLEPGRKLLSSNVFAGHGEYYIFFATRAMRMDESVEPDIVVKIARDWSQPEIDCAYIIREHALPAPVVSK